MVKEDCVIGIGHIDKYLIFALIGGLSQFTCAIMLFKYKDIANYNKHPLIIGFNAGLGMSFAFIPFIILKINSNKAKNNNQETFIKVLSEKAPEKIGTISDFGYLEKFSDKRLRRQKYLILLACALLDFSQKSLTYIFNKLVVNNIWIFNIFFIYIFEKLILKRKLYKHQYLSGVIIILLGIAAIIVGAFKEEGNIFLGLILCLIIEIQYSLEKVLSKFLMDCRDSSPFEITFYEGIFSLIVNSILLTIFTNCPLPDDKKYDDIFSFTYYKGKKYFDHFTLAFSDMGLGETLLFILSACGRLISSFSGHIVIKHYTAPHIVLILIIGEITLAFKEGAEWPNIIQFILFCLVLIMSLIYTEIIEINIFDLEKNTRKNIYLRQLQEANSENYKDILNYENEYRERRIELSEGIEITLEDDDRSSVNSNDF